MKKVDDLDIINYMINTGAPAKEVAEYFDISLSTVRKSLTRIKEQLDDKSIIKQELLSVISNNQEQGRHQGGLSHNSGKKRNVNIDFIVNMAIDILANNLTIQETSIKYNIPTSTISNYLNLLKNTKYQEIYDDLTSLYTYHKKNKTTLNDISLFNMQQKYINKIEENTNFKKN